MVCHFHKTSCTSLMQISKYLSMYLHEPYVSRYMEISWYSTTLVKVHGKILMCNTMKAQKFPCTFRSHRKCTWTFPHSPLTTAIQLFNRSLLDERGRWPVNPILSMRRGENIFNICEICPFIY